MSYNAIYKYNYSLHIILYYHCCCHYNCQYNSDKLILFYVYISMYLCLSGHFNLFYPITVDITTPHTLSPCVTTSIVFYCWYFAYVLAEVKKKITWWIILLLPFIHIIVFLIVVDITIVIIFILILLRYDVINYWAGLYYTVLAFPYIGRL